MWHKGKNDKIIYLPVFITEGLNDKVSLSFYSFKRSAYHYLLVS